MSASDTVIEGPRRERDFAATAWIGRVLDGRYRLDEVLGAGGFAVVFRGRHLSLGRDVAVKILAPEGSEIDATLLARFEREADALARLAHPGVVAATDYGVSEGMPFLVMELVEGHTLRAEIDGGPLPPARALPIVRQMLRALSYAHAQGVLHRDLKPGNVVLFTPNVEPGDEPEPIAKVLDFGLAKIVRGDSATATITAEGVAFGTPGYVSPEVLSGRRADARADLYAVGVMLFEMLCGRRPYGGQSRGAELRATLAATAPPSLAQVMPRLACAAELDAILQLALARDPAERFADAASMLAALDQVDPHRVTGPRPLPRVGPTERRSWREITVPLPTVLVLVSFPTLLALALAVALLLVLAAA